MKRILPTVLFLLACAGDAEVQNGNGLAAGAADDAATAAAEPAGAPSGGEGTFSGMAEGGLPLGEIDGRAEFWTIEPAEGSPTFVLNLHPRQPEGARISLMRVGSGRPEPGTYSVVEQDDGTGFTIIYAPPEQDVAVQGQSGTVTITESTPNRLAGAYDLRAGVWKFSRPGDYSSAADAGTARIAGSFTATCDAAWSADAGRGVCR